MRFLAIGTLLTVGLIGNHPGVSAVPCADGVCSATKLFPRIDIPEIIPEVPKPPNPLPVAPKPVPLAEPKPVPLADPKPAPPADPKPAPPADPKPAPPPDPNPAPACKRNPTGCSAYTFSGKDYATKGAALNSKVKTGLSNPVANDHGFASKVSKFQRKITQKRAPQFGDQLADYFTQVVGIDVGSLFSTQQVWTHFEEYGFPGSISGKLPFVETWTSAQFKAMIAERSYKADASLFDASISDADKPPISEWRYQEWAQTVKDANSANPPVKISPGDLETFSIMNINNADTKAIIEKVQADKGGSVRYTVMPTDTDAWNAFTDSSAGVYLWYMLLNHGTADELNKLIPSKLTVSLEDELPVVTWYLSRLS